MMDSASVQILQHGPLTRLLEVVVECTYSQGCKDQDTAVEATLYLKVSSAARISCPLTTWCASSNRSAIHIKRSLRIPTADAFCTPCIARRWPCTQQTEARSHRESYQGAGPRNTTARFVIAPLRSKRSEAKWNSLCRFGFR